ncbi:heterogeneous nuclear ribonucleo 1-like [Olea europaea subsp. europaea]|uniref:Heterogeneous nuclear ribonucleo 1-like n=1 Tax=Olea europaea subsp. europaea TaxID=158383 RepID=A0A8S0SVN3_OLEEU|nr:heterogeneous nuclear ribonucleo 1-like [Olea europaea subsp. europaea]
MDSDQGKLFIGGISLETDEQKLKEYFQGYGEVLQTVVMRDKLTGKPRGFGVEKRIRQGAARIRILLGVGYYERKLAILL